MESKADWWRLPWLWPRLGLSGRVVWHGGKAALALGGLALVSVFFLIRDHLSSAQQKALHVNSLPSFSEPIWIAIAVAAGALFLLEGAYRVVSRERDLAKAAGDALNDEVVSLTSKTTSLLERVGDLEEKLSRKPLAPEHLLDLRAALAKLIAGQDGTIDDFFLLLAFEEHVPGDPTWNAHHELDKLQAPYDKAVRERQAWLFERTKDLRLSGNAGALVPLLQLREQQIRDGQLSPELPWELRYEPSETLLGSLWLGDAMIGDHMMREEAEKAEAGVRGIWADYPKCEAAQFEIQTAPQIREYRGIIFSDGTILKHRSLDGTRCYMCDPPTP